MRRPVYSSFVVLMAALALSLAVIVLLRFMAQRQSVSESGRSKMEETGVDGFPLRFRDAFNREVLIPSKPQRIITLAPSVTEMVYALGAEDRLVADTRFCIHPPEAVAKEKIGGITDPNLEKILGLSPDLIVGAEITPQEVVGQLDRLGLTTVYFRHTTIDSVYRDILSLSAILGETKRGVQLTATMRARGAILQKRLAELPPGAKPKVLLLLRIDGLYSAGKGSFPHEIIEMAGGENVAAAAETLWPQLSMETVIQSNPDVILVAIGKGKVEADFLQKQWKQMRADPRWKSIRAVANNRIVQIPDDLMTIPGPRLIEAVEMVANGLYPQLTVAPSGKKK